MEEMKNWLFAHPEIDLLDMCIDAGLCDESEEQEPQSPKHYLHLVLYSKRDKAEQVRETIRQMMK